jgi:hypothetical protein
MANEILVGAGTMLVFADHLTDFSGGTAKNSLEVAGTDVQLDLTTLASASGRESAKADLGVKRAARYSVMAAIESDATGFTTGTTIDFYWAPSPIAAAANGNPGQIDGVDAAAPSGYGTLAELLYQCTAIGSLVVENTASTVQVGVVGQFAPPERYGILIVVNNGGQALIANANEHHVVMTPIVDELQ